jgi:hypothetical protein
MSAVPAPAPEPSPVDSAVAAFDHARRHLFPFRFERWLALGLLAFLDQCGRGGFGGANFRLPMGGGSSGNGSGGGTDTGGLDEIGAWLGENVWLVVAIAAAVLVFVFVLSALILWVNSRATFAYVDDVASGRADIERPWMAHADAAWSYFGWQFSVAIGTLVGVLLLVAGVVAAVVLLKENTWALAGSLLVLIPVVLLAILAAALFNVAMHDFVAPVQIAAGVSCGEGLRRVAGLVRSYPLAFFLYVLLKVVLGVVQGVVIFLGACLTCCCILIPVVTQTALQPLFYFERAWPLYLLRQMGYDLVTEGPNGNVRL